MPPSITNNRNLIRLNSIKKNKFWTNPTLPLWAATTEALLGMKLSDYFAMVKPTTPAYHNLCQTKQPPAGVDTLLRNSLKFCIEKALPKPKIDYTMERLTADVRRNYFWLTKGDPDPSTDNYNKKLYIKSSWVPPKATPEIETALTTYKDTITALAQQNLANQKRKHNIPSGPRKLLKTLPDNKDFLIQNTDKGLGPCIWECPYYKTRCYEDHLSDGNTYKRLTKVQAQQRLHAATYQFKILVEKHKETLPKSEYTYFQRSYKEERRIPQFYCTAKIHKTPFKTRPIVSCINSTMGDLSKWVDTQLQQVKHLCPAFLKDSKSLLHKLKKLGKVPDTAFIVSADATSMYTNIDTTHGLQTLKQWFALHSHELPQDYNVDMVIRATEIVMRNNVFQFDDTYWIQLTGTAMGTNLACMYATIYYSYHEETRLLPVYAHQHPVPTVVMPPFTAPTPHLTAPALLLHARLIDDACQIWDSAKLPVDIATNFQAHMEQELHFGILPWEMTKPSRSINFLDLTITLEADRTITTKTYVKEMNLHLYIPPHSAHPKGVLKSLIFGTLQRYWVQNTKMADFTQAVADFYGHLLNREYAAEQLTPLFQEAALAIAKKAKRAARTGEERWDLPTSDPSSRLFIHWTYHPRDISRRTIRQAFETILEPVLKDSGLNFQQLTIAYSTPRNLGQVLTKTQLEEPEDIRVSTYIGPMEDSPANL